MNQDYPEAELSQEDTYEPHPCPFKMEMNNDDTPCTCSPAQMHECAQEI